MNDKPFQCTQHSWRISKNPPSHFIWSKIWSLMFEKFRLRMRESCRRSKGKLPRILRPPDILTWLFFYSENPHHQRIMMISENAFKSVTNTFYYSIDPIFPLNVFPHLENDGKLFSQWRLWRTLIAISFTETATTKTDQYYSHHYCHIGTKSR